MAVKEDLHAAVSKILRDQWNTRDGQVVPEPEDCGLYHEYPVFGPPSRARRIIWRIHPNQCMRRPRLRHAILKRALEGRLVPQDPNDEPATVLLERIRVERSAPAQRTGTAAKKKSSAAKPEPTAARTRD